MKKILFTMVLAIVVFACNTKTTDSSDLQTADAQKDRIEEKAATKEFWASLKALQGKAFEGKLVNAPANDDFAGKKLVMHVLYGDDDKIYVPFNVGDNRSRTWIFTYHSGRIKLKHDHRHEDGSNDEITMYGGIASNSGTASMQVFPADEETLEMLPAAFSNVWWVTIDSARYTYNLRRVGTERIFTVAFDLTKEVKIPEPSWGWENFGK
jgi:hypothetical protein